ncbi:MAG: hypothetical protein ACLR0U_27225 [Enterocloster clostridioformis]
MRIEIRSASSEDDIGRKECQNHLCGEITHNGLRTFAGQKHERKDHKADDIGLADIRQLERAAPESVWAHTDGNWHIESGIWAR